MLITAVSLKYIRVPPAHLKVFLPQVQPTAVFSSANVSADHTIRPYDYSGIIILLTYFSPK